MKAFGSKRTYHDCRVYRAGSGKKILFTTGVKSKKNGRKYDREVSTQMS
jgi:hypothetical protein